MATKWPKLSPIVVDALTEMLQEENENVKRPPELAAKLLALAAEWHTDHKGPQPMPTRQEVAEYLGCSKDHIDGTISQRVAQGYLSDIRETTQGNVQQRDSIIRLRFLKPSRKVLEVVERAKRGFRPK